MYGESKFTDMYREIDKWMQLVTKQQQQINELKKIINSLTGEEDGSKN